CARGVVADYFDFW
nr:immunoglobulin heavy chain junction region [Mus musculus]MBK4185310.1 immunoglobulin heavy chain junction region [Mus musculus]